jgi:hypothetical protein
MRIAVADSAGMECAVKVIVVLKLVITVQYQDMRVLV